MVNARFLVILLFVVCCTGPAQAALGEEQPRPQDLKRLSIEELASIDVTSVSRRPERLSQTPAALSVVGAEDLHRAGVVMIVEALRLADAIDVAHINGNTWGVSARGFSSL